MEINDKLIHIDVIKPVLLRDSTDNALKCFVVAGHLHIFVPIVAQSQEQNFTETRVKSKEARKYILSSLEAIVEPSVIGYAADVPLELEIEREDRRQFVGLLQRMLELDGKLRVRPDTALHCTFISMAHLHRYPHSKR